MSWEGYYEHLCTAGHLRSEDGVTAMYMGGMEKCDCGQPFVANAIVDCDYVFINDDETIGAHDELKCTSCSSKLQHRLVKIYEPEAHKCPVCNLSHFHPGDEPRYRLKDKE